MSIFQFSKILAVLLTALACGGGDADVDRALMPNFNGLCPNQIRDLFRRFVSGAWHLGIQSRGVSIITVIRIYISLHFFIAFLLCACCVVTDIVRSSCGGCVHEK